MDFDQSIHFRMSLNLKWIIRNFYEGTIFYTNGKNKFCPTKQASLNAHRKFVFVITEVQSEMPILCLTTILKDGLEYYLIPKCASLV